jgi:hypothetical protein
MASCKNRNVLADGSGKLWDLANPNLIAISSSNSGTTTDLQYTSGIVAAVTITFADAQTAFENS